MSTALELINRLRSKAREEQITAFASGDDLNIALLSELNQAMRIILEERTWAFSHRSDGMMMMRLSFTETTGAFTYNAVTGATLTLSDLALPVNNNDLGGNFTSSLVLTGHSTHGNTAWDLVTCRISGASSFTATPPTLPVAIVSGTGWQIFTYQYALPTTVRAITDIWHQEGDIQIFQESETDFRQLVPRPNEEHGSLPRVAFVGGTIIPTTTTAGTTGTEVESIKFWPISGSADILNYRYIKRYSNLSAATDTLSGVPLSVEDLIVQLAYARQLQSIQADPQRGLEMEGRVMSEVERKHRNLRFDPRRSRELRSLDSLGNRRSGLTRTYDTVPGWP